MANISIITGIEDSKIIGTDNIIVVIDVLRASSTITTALSNGALKVYVFREIDDAINCFKKVPNCILAGERSGLKIEGFQIGNSPREFSKDLVYGRYISFTSSNCAKTVEAFKNAKYLLLACFLNISTVSSYLKYVSSKYGLNVVLACAGRYGAPSSEDSLCAEIIRDMVLGLLNKPPLNDFSNFLRITSAGRHLIKLGMGSDVEYCGLVDLLNTIPFWDGEGFIQLQFKGE